MFSQGLGRYIDPKSAPTRPSSNSVDPRSQLDESLEFVNSYFFQRHSLKGTARLLCDLQILKMSGELTNLIETYIKIRTSGLYDKLILKIILLLALQINFN